jgi:ankyrin repeat protein
MGPAPFSRAVKRGDIPTVKKMVSKRIVDVNTSLDATGATALMYASRAGHLEMVQCLVEAGAALEVMDASKNAVVIRAIIKLQKLAASLS